MPRRERPLTTHDLARLLGVSQSTVSRALRDSPSISKTQRERIQAEAKRLGYKSDPLVSAFTARVRGYRRSPVGITLAVLSGDLQVQFSEVYRGILSEAESHGYHVDPISFAEVDRDAARLGRALRARGVKGLIVMPVELGLSLRDMDFTGLACAQIAASLKEPRLHTASANHFHNAMLCYRKLHRDGHRRIGLALDAYHDTRLDHQWLGGFTAMRQLLDPGSTAPIFYPEQSTDEGLVEWVKESGFSAVMSYNQYYLEVLREHFPELSFAQVTGGAEGRVFPGANERLERVGKAAVKLVISQIHQNRSGVPDASETVLIPGEWTEGEREGASLAESEAPREN